MSVLIPFFDVPLCFGVLEASLSVGAQFRFLLWALNAFLILWESVDCIARHISAQAEAEFFFLIFVLERVGSFTVSRCLSSYASLGSRCSPHIVGVLIAVRLH